MAGLLLCANRDPGEWILIQWKPGIRDKKSFNIFFTILLFFLNLLNHVYTVLPLIYAGSGIPVDLCVALWM